MAKTSVIISAMNLITLLKKFPNKGECYRYLEQCRWQNGAQCPYCHSTSCRKKKSGFRWKCTSCDRSFSVKVKTVMHGSKLDPRIWLAAISLMVNAKKGIASRQLARNLGVNKDTAWYLQMRIRAAILKNSGLVDELNNWMMEMNEQSTIFPSIETSNIRNQRTLLKNIRIVGKELTFEAHHHFGRKIRPAILSRINHKSFSGIDGLGGFFGLAEGKRDSSRAILPVLISIISLENYWKLLNRGIIGQYHQLTSHYLLAYLSEFYLRYEGRKNGEELCNKVLSDIFVSTNGPYSGTLINQGRFHPEIN